MARRGIGTARGNFRADSLVRWEDEKKMLNKKLEKSRADAARERMLGRENRSDGLTQEVEELYFGGRDGAAKSAQEWDRLMKEIKNGQTMADVADGAAAARKRMEENLYLKKAQEKEKRKAELLRRLKEAEETYKENCRRCGTTPEEQEVMMRKHEKEEYDKQTEQGKRMDLQIAHASLMDIKEQLRKLEMGDGEK